MNKSLYIAEKPSVAQEFANALKIRGRRGDGFIESGEAIVTWCVGHLVTMSYPECYDPMYKRWSLHTLPFIPKQFKYEVIESVAKQFKIVAGLLNRADVGTIYICTDSGREGEYIYRLVDQMAGVKDKVRKRVWIDSQTEDEILRGIREAKDWSEYDNLSSSAYLRAQEDYLMGINFSRLLTLRYGPAISSYLKADRTVLSVGRVMTCVLGMVVKREREVREFVKTSFYRVMATVSVQGLEFDGEWKSVEGSRYFASPLLYKDNGFKERIHAEQLIRELCGGEQPGGELCQGMPRLEEEFTQGVPQQGEELTQGMPQRGGGLPKDVTQPREALSQGMPQPGGELTQGMPQPEKLPLLGTRLPDPLSAELIQIERKKETKNPPLLYNLAELQNDCSRMFKISPDQTLQVVQELYEKKMVTYPRTDARVLSEAVAKEINKNIKGLTGFSVLAAFAGEIMEKGTWKALAKTRYVNDKQITDHYAIVPTGQGLSALRSLSPLALKVYELISRRFLSIFYPAAVYQKYALEVLIDREHFFSSFKVLTDPGYLKVADVSGLRRKGEAADAKTAGKEPEAPQDLDVKNREGNQDVSPAFITMLKSLKKGMKLPIQQFTVKEGETSPPKRYSSGSMILAMENAGQLIEDEELRAQIKGSGIGTSATRAEILKKLIHIKYLSLNGKTQVITPTLLGELIFDVVNASIRQLLNPDLTASWEKGLTMVAQGTITTEEYLQKLEKFVAGRTYGVLKLNNQHQLRPYFDQAARFYQKNQERKTEK